MVYDAERYFRQSEAKIHNGDWDAGLEDLNQALALEPKNIEYLWTRANLQYERDESQQAIEDYTTIIELSSDTDELSKAHHKRAISCEHLGLYEELIRDLDWLVSQDSATSSTYEWRGVHRRKLGDLFGAVSDFTKALQVSPNNERTLLQRGSTYCQLQQYENAIQDFTQILNLPDIHSSMLQAAYHWRGSAFYRLSNYQKALADFNEVMKFYALNTLSDAREYVAKFGLPD